MTSNVNVNVPSSTNPRVSQVRDNFAIIKSEIDNIQHNTLSVRTFLSDITGVTDQRTNLIAAINAAVESSLILKIDCPIFIDINTDRTTPIFLPADIYFDFVGNGKFIVNNLGIPTFCIVHTNNITFRNPTFTWNNTVTSGFVTAPGSIASQFNDGQTKSWLIANKGNIFTSGNPSWIGPSDHCATIVIKGSSSNLKFLGTTTFNCPDDVPAENFMVSCIAIGTEVKAGITYNNQALSSTYFDMPDNISIDELVLDGVCMGIVGITNGVKIKKFISKRYSDVQDSTGAVAQWFSPPHALYESWTSGTGLEPSGNSVGNYIDYGTYVGHARRRGSGGYCNALKFSTFHFNDVYCTRPDGTADIISLTKNCGIDNLYSEYNSNVFSCEFTGSTTADILTVTAIASGYIYAGSTLNENDTINSAIASGKSILAYGTNGTTGTGGVGTYAITSGAGTVASKTLYSALPFLSIRFPGGAGTYNGVKILKGILIDNGSYSLTLPMNGSSVNTGSNCYFDLVQYVNEFRGFNYPGFAFPGSKIKVKLDIIFKNGITQAQTNRGIVAFQGTAGQGSTGVNYDVSFTGWKNLKNLTNVSDLRSRILFTGNDANATGNYAIIRDISNNYITVVNDRSLEETYVVNATLTPTAGGVYTSTLYVPSAINTFNFIPALSSAMIRTAFGTTAGLTGIQIGFAGNSAEIGTLTATTVNTKLINSTPLSSSSTARAVTLTPVGGTFDGTGVIQVYLTLTRRDIL